MSPSVSILIPCYNAERWINQAIQSAVDQTWPDCEVIVIDDGSTDRSPEILRSWEEKVTVHIRENRGGNPTRNELLHQARGDWVQFLDADDYLLPEKVSHQLDVLATHPEARVIYSPLIVEHHADQEIRKERWNPHRAGDHDPWTYHLSWTLTQTGGALFHRQSLLEVGGWDESQSCCQDNGLFFRLLKAGAPFVHCDTAEAVYRRFSGGSVSTGEKPHLLKEILRLLDEGEAYLQETGQMTPRRRNAANQMRFRLARTIWPANPSWATGIMKDVQERDAGFLPEPGAHAPRSYLAIYRLTGFTWAERISSLKRRCLPS